MKRGHYSVKCLCCPAAVSPGRIWLSVTVEQVCE